MDRIKKIQKFQPIIMMCDFFHLNDDGENDENKKIYRKKGT